MIANLQAQSFLPPSVSVFAKAFRMAEADKALIERLVAHTGLSASKVAVAAGLTPSTLTRPLHQPVKHRLSVPTLEKLKSKWPEFAWDDAPAMPPTNALPIKMEGASLARMDRNFPVYGTALGADEIVDGEAIEQTTLNTGEVIEYRKRPTILDGRADAYGLYVQGSSMAPRFRDGQFVCVESRKRPSVGEDAVVYLRTPDDCDGERASSVLIKTVVRKTAAYIELEQYTPAHIFRIPMERVFRIDRVIPWDELLD